MPEASPRAVDPAPEFPGSQRRGVLAWRCVVLAMLVGVLAEMAALPHWETYLVHHWLQLPLDGFFDGIVYAQLCLLAFWATYSPLPKERRWPRAIGLAALLGVASAWHYNGEREGVGPESAVYKAVGFAMTVALLGCVLERVRRRKGWRLSIGPAAVPCRFQFSLRRLFFWMTATALILAFALWTTPETPERNTSLAEGLRALQAATGAFLVGSIVGLVLVVPSAGWLLGDARRWRFAAWLMVLAGAIGVVGYYGTLWWLWATSDVSSGYALAMYGKAMAFDLSVAPEISFLLTLLGSLMVLRLIGYRLTHEAAENLSPELTPATVAQHPWWQSSVSYMILVLGVLGSWCARSAWHFEERQRLTALACRQLESFGLNVRGMNGYLEFNFPRGKPVSDAALATLEEYANRLDGIALFVGQVPLTEAQVARIGQLKHLGRLQLIECAVTDAGFAHLHNLADVQLLSLTDSQISDVSLGKIGTCQELTLLDLGGTQIGNAGMAALTRLSKLELLKLSRTRVSDEGIQAIAQIENLQDLLLEDTPITDAAIPWLAAMPHLQLLAVGNTKMTDAGKAELQKRLPKCRVWMEPLRPPSSSGEAPADADSPEAETP